MTQKRREILEHIFYDEFIQDKLQSEEMKLDVKRLDEYITELELETDIIEELLKMIVKSNLNYFTLGSTISVLIGADKE